LHCYATNVEVSLLPTYYVSRRMRWARRVERVGEMGLHNKIRMDTLKAGDYWEDQDADGRVT
jgi:hypothetical protein